MRISDWSSDVCSSDLAPEDGGLVDENGMPIELPDAAAPPEGGEPVPPPVDEGPVLDQQWIEEQTGRRAPAEPGAAPKQTSPAPPVISIPPARPQQRNGASEGN